ncbi:MAG: outer membrane beta-barrel protein [Gammaproteobacteria bacterium]|nr:outer membrane beta-barrel protein [Gammaproteobacteria bacterium]
MAAKYFVKVLTAVLSLGLLSNAAIAADDGSEKWLFRAGFSVVDPKTNNGYVPLVDDQLDVKSATSFTFNITYMLDQNWGVELLAAYPFEHDVNLRDNGRIAKVKQLPPTLSLNYHARPGEQVRPYAGLGVNYTIFFDESERGILTGADLDLDNSIGIALQAGVDIDITKKLLANVNVRWIDIEADANLNGGYLATAKVDPWVYSLNLGWKF